VPAKRPEPARRRLTDLDHRDYEALRRSTRAVGPARASRASYLRGTETMQTLIVGRDITGVGAFA
jgi:hypothetical protein